MSQVGKGKRVHGVNSPFTDSRRTSYTVKKGLLKLATEVL